MDENSELENYRGLVNLLTFIRWFIIISLGISLVFIIRYEEYLLAYSIIVFRVLAIIEIIITSSISLFKRKIRSANPIEI